MCKFHGEYSEKLSSIMGSADQEWLDSILSRELNTSEYDANVTKEEYERKFVSLHIEVRTLS